MNRARQDSITTEIMEIVSGAEALGKGKGKGKNVRLVDLDFSDAVPSGPSVAVQGLTSVGSTMTATIKADLADDAEGAIEGIGQ